MKIGSDIKTIRGILELSQEELAYCINVSQKDIARWENDSIEPGDNNINKIYSFAIEKGIDLNVAYEFAFKSLYEKDKKIVLFHGPKNKITFPLTLKHSKVNNDFGIGFYMGEKYEQAAQYIRVPDGKRVYSFVIDTKDLRIMKFNVNREWMLAISYYRGHLDEYVNNKEIRKIVNKIKNADLIIAPIADNSMYNTINQFVDGEISDEQCINALSCSELGYQYVVKNTKTLKKVKLIKEMFVCDIERKNHIENKKLKTIEWLENSKKQRSMYKNKGKYIWEVLHG